MTLPHQTNQVSGRIAEGVHRVADLIDRVTDSFDGRSRAFDEALEPAELAEPAQLQRSGRDYPGPEAGCGHVRLVH